ncbi:hypothetical protein GGF32_008696 [Allomyces javanicus]|nr:hypothetical protein GGF32_008696 [Allomyces javanicus]
MYMWAIAADPALADGAAVAAGVVREIVLAVPGIAWCTVCGSRCTEKSFDATVFTIAYAQPVRLQTWRCTNLTCPFVAPWDGREFGIINANNVTLLAFELALVYLELFHGSGASVASWWAAKVTQYLSVIDAQPDEAAKLANTWTGLRSRMGSWIAAFVYLMQIDADIFDCACPAGKLDMVAADGIVLSIAASRLKTLTRPWSAGESVHRASTRADRNVPQPRPGNYGLQLIAGSRLPMLSTPQMTASPMTMALSVNATHQTQKMQRAPTI